MNEYVAIFIDSDGCVRKTIKCSSREQSVKQSIELANIELANLNGHELSIDEINYIEEKGILQFENGSSIQINLLESPS
jgi:hypothetical protein